uniref:Uncharacterized protein n=1 Tax=Ixodes ricinus TaxID=34613 RepID=A0A6B0USW8_IXORI
MAGFKLLELASGLGQGQVVRGQPLPLLVAFLRVHHSLRGAGPLPTRHAPSRQSVPRSTSHSFWQRLPLKTKLSSRARCERQGRHQLHQMCRQNRPTKCVAEPPRFQACTSGRSITRRRGASPPGKEPEKRIELSLDFR